jgi:hypothetical protein
MQTGSDLFGEKMKFWCIAAVLLCTRVLRTAAASSFARHLLTSGHIPALRTESVSVLWLVTSVCRVLRPAMLALLRKTHQDHKQLEPDYAAGNALTHSALCVQQAL